MRQPITEFEENLELIVKGGVNQWKKNHNFQLVCFLRNEIVKLGIDYENQSSIATIRHLEIELEQVRRRENKIRRAHHKLAEKLGLKK